MPDHARRLREKGHWELEETEAGLQWHTGNAPLPAGARVVGQRWLDAAEVAALKEKERMSTSMSTTTKNQQWRWVCDGWEEVPAGEQ